MMEVHLGRKKRFFYFSIQRLYWSGFSRETKPVEHKYFKKTSVKSAFVIPEAESFLDACAHIGATAAAGSSAQEIRSLETKGTSHPTQPKEDDQEASPSSRAPLPHSQEALYVCCQTQGKQQLKHVPLGRKG